MKHYKQLLLNKLTYTGWEIVSRDDHTDWWLEEYWKIRSIRQNWGYELLVLFLVDPVYEGNKKSQAVWAIGATKKMPPDRPIGSGCIIQMDLQKGKFDFKLSEFVKGINEHRDRVNF